MTKLKKKKIKQQSSKKEEGGDKSLASFGTKKKKRTEIKKIIDIYRDHGGRKIDMTKIDRKDPNRRKRILILIIIVLIVLLAITLGGYYFYTKSQKKFSEEYIKIEINVPDEIVSGKESSITVNCLNNSKIDLNSAELTVILPKNFNLIS